MRRVRPRADRADRWKETRKGERRARCLNTHRAETPDET